MSELEYGMGALESPPDPRDWDIRVLPEYYLRADRLAAAGVWPARWNVTPVPPLYYQDGLPECFGFATARMVGSLNRHDPKVDRWVAMDGHGFALLVKEFDGIPGPGSTGRATLQVARSRGVPELLQGAARAAGRPGSYRIASYWRVPLERDAVKTALMAFGTLICALPWPSSWNKVPTTGKLPPRSGGAQGHMFTLDGWDNRRGFLAVNQWHSQRRPWGSNGRFWLPFAELERHGWECWKALDRPGV